MIYTEHSYISYSHVTVYLDVGTLLLQLNNKADKNGQRLDQS